MILKAVTSPKPAAEVMKSGSAAANEPAAIESAPIRLYRAKVRVRSWSGLVREHRVFKRDEHAQIACGWVYRADKSDDCDDRDSSTLGNATPVAPSTAHHQAGNYEDRAAGR